MFGGPNPFVIKEVYPITDDDFIWLKVAFGVFRKTVGVSRQLIQTAAIVLGRVNLKVAPRRELEVGAPKIRPPYDSRMERVIASPTSGLCDKECTESLVTAVSFTHELAYAACSAAPSIGKVN